MEDSRKPTSKVIDSLHSQIDSLKEELTNAQLARDDYRKKHVAESKKNESYVDQLANAKHENDMINALLKRKERRIGDLEEQYNTISSTNESLQLNNKSMKIRCESLQESSASSTAEYERLKIAYDALLASQVEYKKHFQREMYDLTLQFDKYKKDSSEKLELLADQLTNNDRDIDTLLESLANKRKTMDNLYANKNRLVLDLLSKLAKAAKVHGQASKNILLNDVEIIQSLLDKYPDFNERLSYHEDTTVDIEELLNESTEALSNSSFDEEATLINSPDPNNDKPPSNVRNLSRNNSIQQKKRKNNNSSKRNSMRFDSRGSFELQAQIQSFNKRNPSRKVSDESKTRTPTPPYSDHYENLKNIKSENQGPNAHKPKSSKNSKRKSYVRT